MRSLILVGTLAFGFAAAGQAATGSVRMYVRHEVASYAAWQKVNADLADMRGRMGVTAQAVYRSAENLNDITVTQDFETLEQARAFAGSPDLKAALLKAGVTGLPEIWFTTLAAGKPAETDEVRMYLRHKVADFAAWQKAYDASAAARHRMGVLNQAVHRSADDPNDVTVTHDFKNADLARAFASSAELRTEMASAGVVGPLRIWFTLRDDH